MRLQEARNVTVKAAGKAGNGMPATEDKRILVALGAEDILRLDAGRVNKLHWFALP